MITAFTVKNFKAIGDDPVRIELKPITLLFGANSAGKSSILDALIYADAIFNNYGLDAKKTTLGGDALDLGGFTRFIYKNDINKSIKLRFDVDFKFSETSRKTRSDFDFDFDSSYYLLSPLMQEKIGFTPNELLSKINSYYIEIEISWDFLKNRPYASTYEIGFNNEHLATIKSDINKERAAVRFLNIGHSIFTKFWVKNNFRFDKLLESFIKSKFFIFNLENRILDDIQDQEIKTSKGRQQVFERLGRIPASTLYAPFSSSENLNLILSGHHDALTPITNGSSFQFSKEIWIKSPRNKINNKTYYNDLDWLASAHFFENLFARLFIEPRRHVAQCLNSLLYLGPLREIPPRHFSGIPLPSRKHWSTGLAAWDVLYWIAQKQLASYPRSNKSLTSSNLAKKRLDIINDWLDRRLNTGYQVLIEYYREISSSHPFFIALAAGRSIVDMHEQANELLQLPEKSKVWLQDKVRNIKLTPHEIGIGISQVLPVVVAAVGTKAPLVVIEQPELHIHPAVQVQLGDLFITQSSNNKFFLIETHSEHLLLRLLRRINETFEGKLPSKIEPCIADDVAIYYLEKGSQGMHSRRLEISEDGDSKGDWPEGFFEERRAELF